MNWRSRGVAVAAVAALLFAVRPASAHVDYVTDDEGTAAFAHLVETVLGNPLEMALLAGGAGAVSAVALGYVAAADRIRDVQVARETLASYRPYLPWMVRLSVGLPLVGAGFNGYLFTPSLPVGARMLQIGLGFLLLFGLASRLVAAVGLVAYVWALAVHGSVVLLASEYVAGFLAVVVLGSGAPSADDLLGELATAEGTFGSRILPLADGGRRMLDALGVEKWHAPLAIRGLLGLNLAYLGVSQKWLQPSSALAVVAKYDLTAVVPVSPELWVLGAGLVELLVGLLLVAGLFTRGAAAAAFLLLTTTLFGLPDDPVLAHVTLFGLSSAVLVTGSGPYALDRSLVPAVRERVGWGSRTAGTT